MPGFSKLAVKLPEHAPAILKHFNVLRREGLLCDCVLAVEDMEFLVHRCLKPTLLMCFQLQNSFSSALSKVFALIFFINQLCALNCLGIWRYGWNYYNWKLKKSAWFCIASHFMDVSSEEFLSLSKEDLCTILCSDDLDISSEMDVYRAAMIWLQHDLPGRKQDMVDVLTHVRFPLLPTTVLTSLLGSQMEELSPDRSVHELLIQARNAQRLRSTRSRQKKISAFQNESLTPRRSRKAIVVVGGYSGEFVSNCEVYDKKTESWQELDFELSLCEHLHWIGVIGMRLYALGGSSIANVNQVISKFTSSAVKQLQSSAFSTEWGV